MSFSKLTIPNLAEELRTSKGMRALWATLTFVGGFAFALGFWPEPLPEALTKVPGLEFVYLNARAYATAWGLALGGIALASLSAWRFVVVNAYVGAVRTRLFQLREEQRKRLESV